MAEITQIVYCQCCGKRVMARIVGGQLIIENHAHGDSHSVSLPIADLGEIGKKEGLTKSK